MSLHPLFAEITASHLKVNEVASPTYRGWWLSFEYGRHTATHHDFDASYEGPEDGWVGSHPCFYAATQRDLIEQIEGWYADEAESASA